MLVKKKNKNLGDAKEEANQQRLQKRYAQVGLILKIDFLAIMFLIINYQIIVLNNLYFL